MRGKYVAGNRSRESPSTNLVMATGGIHRTGIHPKCDKYSVALMEILSLLLLTFSKTYKKVRNAML